VATTGNELDTTDHGPIVPGHTHGTLVPVSTTAAANANAGTARPLDPDAVTIQRIPEPILPVPNADRTVAGLRAAFRRCYQNGLANEPGMQGQLVVTTRIEPNGSVESAKVTSNSGLSAAVGACIARQVQNAQFDRPAGGASTLQIPVKFVQQR
jgi:TonB family protein